MRKLEKNIAPEVVEAAIRDRVRMVHDRFLHVTLLGLTDSRLISIIEEIAGYWPSSLRTALTSFCCEAVGGESPRIVDASVVLKPI